MCFGYRVARKARDESGELIAQIKAKVKEELGVIAMEMEIENMERQIAALLKKREQLGFSRYNDSLMPGSQAKILVDKRTGTASEKVRRLEERKTDAISRIWTAETMSTALAVLEAVRNA